MEIPTPSVEGIRKFHEIFSPERNKPATNSRIVSKQTTERSFLEQDSTIVPKFAYRSFCPMGILLGLLLVEDEGWHLTAERYNHFLQTRKNLRIVFLELGVGYNTLVIIKYPFWQMTAKNRKSTYACINLDEAFCPKEIERQAVCVDMDIDNVLSKLIA